MLDDIDTPAVLIDVDKADANLIRAQNFADANGLKLRPHIKTHKLVRFARRQVDLGAVGITCQKVGEAEVMADGGITDILLPYNILGGQKLYRLKALARRITLTVSADSAATVDGYAEAFAAEARPLAVFVECDTGAGRCGVQSPEAALDLARRIAVAPGLVFAGLMTYPAKGGTSVSDRWLAEARALLGANGLAPAVVTTGGTPDLWRANELSAADEYRPGTYIYLDRFQVEAGVGTIEDCALTVLSTVVSRPTPDRAILDAGSKALTSDLLGLEGYGLILGYPNAAIVSLSEEHATVDLSASAAKPVVGERVRIVPNHCCPVTNLFDEVVFLKRDGTAETVAVDARGRVR